MKFRDYDVDEVKVLTAESPNGLEDELKKLDKEYIFMDLQYGSFYVPGMFGDGRLGGPTFSALALLQRKKKGG